MTIILGVQYEGKVYMGGDSAVVIGGHALRLTATPKVFKRGDFLIGVAGDARLCKLIKYNTPLPSEAEPLDGDYTRIIAEFSDNIIECCAENGAASEDSGQIFIEGDIIIGYKGVLYHLDPSMAVTITQNGVEAIGAGNEVGLGAYAALPSKMSVENRILKAMEISQQYKTGVRAPFYVLSI